VNRFAFAKRHGDAGGGYPHIERTLRHKIGIDRAPRTIVDGAKRECIQVEIRAQFAIHPGEQILVERRRHAGAIVVREFEYLRVFLEIVPDQERIARSQRGGKQMQQPLRISRLEVADIRTQIQGEYRIGRTEIALG
jgi:hypothetical protein